jgi:hypothetical protein
MPTLYLSHAPDLDDAQLGKIGDRLALVPDLGRVRVVAEQRQVIDGVPRRPVTIEWSDDRLRESWVQEQVVTAYEAEGFAMRD